ncbi:hypothetical protein KXV92_004108 [Aspergillus fumigatus]|nr:hypothetical protein KXX42_002778 [Aspergillus fumigatus]KAH1548253.1 hypothetical protein KXX57_001846 [Aspergillus fumigatus]KAH1973663.1 hypothetical protein KXW88_001316 [Aspergillus fumigatus]KAH2749817.1 hypothetical protein KXV94_003315 [Aspergillus fumigatus]KAH2913034.1 hypothetical protein KXW25_001273 [Aspergillus fumigatus]
MPSVPDAEIYPEASGPAKALVDRHQAEQPLKLHAGWFCSLVPTLACPTGQSDGNDLKLKSFILEYYEEAYPDHQRRLLPGDPYEKARAKVWMDFVTTWEFLARLKESTKEMHPGGPTFLGESDFNA